MEQDLLNHTLVYVSRCEDGTTEHDFVQINHVDEDLGPILEELIQIQQRTGHAHIATGTLMQHSDAARDACRCLPDREETFEKILTFLRSVVLEHPVRPVARSLMETMEDFFAKIWKVVFPTLQQAKDVTAALASMAGLTSLVIENRYPECSICLSDEYTAQNLPMLTTCGHFFHADCSSQLTECPNCRQQCLPLTSCSLSSVA